MFFCCAYAQKDSIYLYASFSNSLRQIAVHQRFVYTNPLRKSIDKIKLLNWVAAYKRTGTPLAERKMEDRKSDLYFSKKAELGRLLSFTINGTTYPGKLSSETLYFPLKNPLKPGEKVELELNYSIELPNNTFTGYGYSDEKALLKYFFIVPDGFETEEQRPKSFLDIEETQFGGKYWSVKLQLPEAFSAESNLKKTGSHTFSGYLNNDPQFYLSTTGTDQIIAKVNSEKTNVIFGYTLTPEEKQNLEFYIPLQLQFIQKKCGIVPEKIFISEKERKKNAFVGNYNINFWKFHYQMFPKSEKNDMDYFSIITTSLVDGSFIEDKNKNHWLKNGLKTYLEFEYLKEFYSDKKLLGDLPEQVSVFGLKPLKMFYASKLKLLERYGLGYQYIASQNLDQNIGTEYAKLSNFNQIAISHFETGSLIHFLADKMGEERFEAFAHHFFRQYENQPVDTSDFLEKLEDASNHSSDFLKTYIDKRSKINFRIRNAKKTDDELSVKIDKNTLLNVPFKLSAETENDVQTYWFDTPNTAGNEYYTIPNNGITKLLINDDYIFPESKYRDNYMYTKGLFSNMKKVRFKLFQDVPNPEYNEIYVNPRLNFNAYDKVLLGVNLKNKSVFDQNFLYSFTPYYSTGTNSITGSVGASYSFRPADRFFRSWQLGFTGTRFHYDYGLQYKKATVFSILNFAKDHRSNINQNISFTYNYFQKDLTPEMVAQNDYDQYHLWSIGYGYSDNKLIHEFSWGSSFQWMEDFQKLSVEAFYRWEYAKNKKISFRIFSGYFFRNDSKTRLFDYGISRISNYSFSYGLLGQSATEGILSQQFVLAEGGFKSAVGSSVNHWLSSFNVDAHVWKPLNIYADVGVYKNKYEKSKVVWDSGIKLKVIPDFLEIYFPVQSSLGFEPSFKNYASRIRYTLVFNLSSLTSYFRRGWF